MCKVLYRLRMTFAMFVIGPEGQAEGTFADMTDALVPVTQTPYPRPAASRDFTFLYEGFQARKLLVRRCSRCGRYVHPPGPLCPPSRGCDWRVCESTARGPVH